MQDNQGVSDAKGSNQKIADAKGSNQKIADAKGSVKNVQRNSERGVQDNQGVTEAKKPPAGPTRSRPGEKAPPPFTNDSVKRSVNQSSIGQPSGNPSGNPSPPGMMTPNTIPSPYMMATPNIAPSPYIPSPAYGGSQKRVDMIENFSVSRESDANSFTSLSKASGRRVSNKALPIGQTTEEQKSTKNPQ